VAAQAPPAEDHPGRRCPPSGSGEQREHGLLGAEQLRPADVLADRVQVEVDRAAVVEALEDARIDIGAAADGGRVAYPCADGLL
jgi:hypothetical protein